MTDDISTANVSQKAIDQATQIQELTKERDLYENKLKALTLAMASTAEENRKLEQKDGELKKLVDDLREGEGDSMA